VDDIAEPDEPALARAIIDLGDSLNMRVIAEGVEDEAQVVQLTDLGCRWGQGYYFSRPQAVSELDALLVVNGVEGWASVAPSGPAGHATHRRAARRRLARASV
jgi:EAL domain-containing protein (putative c-di-GMP-specific phosphodiesterase class I)